MKKLLLCHLIIAVLYLTWLFPPFSTVWNWIDVKSYHLLSTLLTTNPSIRSFWAICNSSWIDWFHDIIMASFLIYYICKGPRATLKNSFIESPIDDIRRRQFSTSINSQELPSVSKLPSSASSTQPLNKAVSQCRPKLRRCAQMLTAIAFSIAIITIVNRAHPTRIDRKSPTKLYKWTAPRLSKEITWVNVKDKSSASFPSDHAVVAFLFVGIVFIFMGPRLGLLATYYGIFFILPRLVVGGHWLSDIFVGSASIALFALSWLYATPLAQRVSNVVEVCLDVRRLRQIDRPR